MYFEVFLKVTIAIFAVFGVYSLMILISECVCRSQNIVISVEVDSKETAENVEHYLNEAEKLFFLRSGSEITVVLQKQYATVETLEKIEQRNLRYYIV